MSAALRAQFAKAKAEARPALVTFLTAGYPEVSATVPLLEAFQASGVDVIELGFPFSDPVADGPTIQQANIKALENGVTVQKTLDLVAEARSKGVTIPIVLMGYYNPVIAYGEAEFVKAAAKAGVNGFIVVDLPPEAAGLFRKECSALGLSYIPLVAPSTSDERLETLCSVADSFIYTVSRMGTTGASTTILEDLPQLVARIRKYSKNKPIAVGFGVSTREHFVLVGKVSDGVVIGSKIINLVTAAKPEDQVKTVEEFVRTIVGGKGNVPDSTNYEDSFNDAPVDLAEEKHKFNPLFGEFGGQYVPEALHTCLEELEAAFDAAVDDPTFWEEFRSLYAYIGRPSLLHLAERLTEYAGGAEIWLKREDLNHTGSHKINNALAQVLIARRLGKSSVIAETGAGQHGVATATACAKFGLKCKIFMGAEDVRRQALNVFRIRLLGAEVVAVTNGTQTLRDATLEAFRYWVLHLDSTHYIVGSAIGPHPYPTLVRTFQSVIGQEAKKQFYEAKGCLPDAVVACVGGGSNSTGLFSPFEKDLSVKMVGVEAGGLGVDTDRHLATLCVGKPGVFHGVRTIVLQDRDGQVHDTHSVSAGLDYPGVGPELAGWKMSGRAEFVAATDAQALLGFKLLSQLEGIIPALESSHAVYGAIELAKKLGKGKALIVNISGRGDKDVQSVAEVLPKLGDQIGWDLRFDPEHPDK